VAHLKLEVRKVEYDMNFQKLLKESGISPGFFARMTGTSPSTVYKWSSGDHPAPACALFALQAIISGYRPTE